MRGGPDGELKETTMPSVQTKQEVTIEGVQEALANELGASYRVAVDSDSTLKIGRTGVIPAKVTLIRRGNLTTFKVSTTGLILSRVLQATSINPKVKRALEKAYPETPRTE
jgi:hypothetical protein